MSLGGNMVRSAETVFIARGPQEVFRFVADLRNEPKWHTDVDSVPAGTDPVPVVGKTYPLKFKPFMGTTDGTLTAVEFQPDARIVYRGEFGGLKPTISYMIEPAGEGTRFTRSVELHPSGLKMLMTPVLALMVPRNNKAVVGNLKRELEA
jgi:carbon monoxide dehydrogenase subunit G